MATYEVVGSPRFEPPSRLGEAGVDHAATERGAREIVPHDSSAGGVSIRPSLRPLFARDHRGVRDEK